MTAKEAIVQSTQTDSTVRVTGLTLADFQSAWNEDEVAGADLDSEDQNGDLRIWGWSWITAATKSDWSVLITA